MMDAAMHGTSPSRPSSFIPTCTASESGRVHASATHLVQTRRTKTPSSAATASILTAHTLLPSPNKLKDDGKCCSS
ncbi:hypothetical protein BV25DRAFT_1833562 [Artomyces pyxidatus]|uniref:Uncharacterized protein n=1 Tax=Artomyces pyxidatus TaxID=48021 RepID=A0ACB8SEI0_9AGAM|nr:hypothetical protein BV25DRAFT_1833562 [Artomyces pyxidatus]